MHLPTRVPAALATAVLVAGCVLTPTGPTPTGKKGPVSYEVKVKKVDALTRAFSLENNAGVKRASESIQRLVQALTGIMAQPASMPESSAGRLRYELSRAMRDVGDAGSQATYDLAGIETINNATFTYDDETRELTGIVTPDAELAFKFVNDGRTRRWEATIVRSPDKTTGTFSIEVEGGWTSQPTMTVPTATVPICPPRPSLRPKPSPRPSATPYAWPSVAPTAIATTQPTDDANATPSPTPTATAGLIANNAGGYALHQADDDAYEPEYDQEYDQQDEPAYEDEYCEPQPMWTPPPPPPFKVFGGEYPNVVSSVAFKLSVVPQGDKALAFSLTGSFDEPEAFPGQAFQVPTHWELGARVPKVTLDWESRMHLDPGKATFKADGKMVVQGGPDGDDTFKFKATFDEASKRLAASMAHVDAGMELAVAGSMNQPKPEKAGLYSTETGELLGTLEPDPARPGVVVIKMKKDGQKIDWQLLPTNLFPGMIQSPPMATTPMMTPKKPMASPKPRS